MSVAVEINKNLSDEEIYKSLTGQIHALINPDEPIISNLSNLTAALKDAFDKISWVGFYLNKEDKLYLGPFQGKVACTIIDFGKGVCGTALQKRETIIVEDVDKFPGHIACDGGSRSEIVVPLKSGEKISGVLDLDSYNLAAFNETDKKYLEIICSNLVARLDLNFQEPIIK